jgi:3-hydroxybutyryl-CoA dehydrogenase
MHKIAKEYLLVNKFIVKNFSDSLSLKNIGIVGSGQMGSGIAYVFGRYVNMKIFIKILFRVSKHNVFIYDSNKGQLEKCSKYAHSIIDKEITKGTLKKAEKEEILSNFNFTDDFNVFKNCQFVIEAIPENFELKSKLFKSLDDITNRDVILASNTSSISITKLAAVTSKPHKVIGMHFMNPVPVMKLVEVIRGLQTTDDTFKQTTE